jgi:phi13 family phage major tail protein
MDKVKFGISNCHVFPIISMNAGIPTYASPIAVPGAVSFSLDQQGDINKFYADNIVYYQSASNNGYQGDLEVARIPDAVYEQIFKYAKDSNGVYTECGYGNCF